MKTKSSLTQKLLWSIIFLFQPCMLQSVVSHVPINMN